LHKTYFKFLNWHFFVVLKLRIPFLSPQENKKRQNKNLIKKNSKEFDKSLKTQQQKDSSNKRHSINLKKKSQTKSSTFV
jgi:hypothetical protein